MHMSQSVRVTGRLAELVLSADDTTFRSQARVISLATRRKKRLSRAGGQPGLHSKFCKPGLRTDILVQNKIRLFTFRVTIERS